MQDSTNCRWIKSTGNLRAHLSVPNHRCGCRSPGEPERSISLSEARRDEQLNMDHQEPGRQEAHQPTRRSLRLQAGKKPEQERSSPPAKKSCPTSRRSELKLMNTQTPGESVVEVLSACDLSSTACNTSAEVLMQDSILLHIFQYLTWSELAYIAGPVCKTWRRVSQDITLWKDKELYYPGFIPNPIQYAQGSRITHEIQFMRIAPQLKQLSLHFLYVYSPSLDELLSHTQCQVSSLNVDVWSESHLTLLLCFLKRQKKCLKKLSINGKNLHAADIKTVKALWKIVGELSELKEIKIWECIDLLEVEYKSEPLKSLTLHTITVLDSGVHANGALQAIVKASCKSLRVLKLPRGLTGDALKALSLKDCPNLEELCIPCLKEITEIENCSALRVLKIMNSLHAAPVLSIAEYLKKSAIVQNLVKFKISCPLEVSCNKITSSISCMPNLVELKILGSIQHPVKNMVTLLQKLPLLEKLDCNNFPMVDSDMEALADGLLPSLKKIVIPYHAREKIHAKLPLLSAKRSNLAISN